MPCSEKYKTYTRYFKGKELELPVLPGLCVFPTHIARMVEVQQQSFSAIEKAETEDIVVEKGGNGIEQGIPEKCG